MSSNRAGRCMLVAGFALAAVMGAAGPAAAAPEQRAGVFKVTFSGYVSQAVWSTCPDPAAEDLGTICTNADVMVFYAATKEQAGSEFHLHDKKSGIVKTFDSTCEIRDVAYDPGVVERACVSLLERFGRATDADVDVDPRLNTTTATATVPVQIVDFVNEDTYGTLDVTADFSGTGAVRRIDERWHDAGRDGMSLEYTRGWERDCTAAATFDGADVPGELVSCSMMRVNQGDIRIYPNQQSGR